MRVTRLCTALALVALVSVLSGCVKTLDSAEDVRPFLRDVANGKASDWKLAKGAKAAAIQAWDHESLTSSLADDLRENGKDWACYTAKATDLDVKAQSYVIVPLVSPAQRKGLVDTATKAGATEDGANDVIDKTLGVYKEAPAIISSVCDSVEELNG
jgi:hypothetical protein